VAGTRREAVFNDGIGINIPSAKKKRVFRPANDVFRDTFESYLAVAINAWNSGSFFSASLVIFSAIPQLFSGRS